jgi:hypothetical protein
MTILMFFKRFISSLKFIGSMSKVIIAEGKDIAKRTYLALKELI